MSRVSLFTSSDEAQWSKALDSYKQSITFVEKSKKKGSNLQELDNWYKPVLVNLIIYTVYTVEGTKANCQRQ